MDTKTEGGTGSVPVWPEKTFTQHEVDDLLAEKGEDSYSQSVDAQRRLNKDNVEKLVKKSNRILIRIRSHALPVDLFPDEINAEEGRITVINRHFFSSEVHSVDIKDISNVFINRNIIFAQLEIVSRTFEDNEITIKNLWPREAIFVRRIIEGLRVFDGKQIDTSIYTKDELVAKLEELSTTQIVT